MHLGKSAINETDAGKEQNFTVEQLIIHSGFNDIAEFENDIGMPVCVGVGLCVSVCRTE